MDEEKCNNCGHPKSHHHEVVGCLNRHCHCGGKQWYYEQQKVVERHVEERRAERARLGSDRITRGT
jgi:hypothetical protein